MNERKYYPQYCHKCHWPFVADKQNVPCPECGSENVVNCYGETYAMVKARYGENEFVFNKKSAKKKA